MSLWTRDGALEQIEQAPLWVLDIDGVLLDPKPSFYRAAKETAWWAAQRALGRDPSMPVQDEDIAAFKAAGGWNDDFELAVGLAWGLVARELVPSHPSIPETAQQASGGLQVLREALSSQLGETFEALVRKQDPLLIRARCAARYSGRSRCRAMYGIDPDAHPDLPDEGLWPVESILCDAARLSSQPRELAFFTGRNGPEAELAAERMGLSVPNHLRVVDDGRYPRKPAPDGLVALAAHANGRPVFYVGDSIDDQHAAIGARERGANVVFARVIGDGAVEHDAGRALEQGADLVIAGLDALLDRLDSERTK